jgi:hypothetical protein
MDWYCEKCRLAQLYKHDVKIQERKEAKSCISVKSKICT